ncbi:hypothetical protein Lrub_1846 [Legionella rubrilucens]|uniref:Secreted protein n=1 Tax=Legionella rubrilucens TaxID=458 RepID=A0A0W0XQP2_9GAMM|nr:hypothetical protein [Legionella rubrilucens]KTD46924.1 hypothetical protein Lrub_1846 [Legionella rubrilucens]
MSIKKFSIVILGTICTNLVFADLPPEVIGSCKQHKPVNSSVTFINIDPPEGLGDDEPKCLNHAESTENSLNYGSIICNDENYLILKGSRINLKTAQNHSVNPSISPGADIAPVATWSKITFDNNDYLCISMPLSPSGTGASVEQYYIVENAYNNSTPIIHYYFFNQEIMPTTSTN